MAIHTGLHPVYWGVGKSQIKHFMSDVRDLANNGQITNLAPADSPYADDKFSSVGPNAYQITDQYIKPVTGRIAYLPYVSYALLKNYRIGCRCDIFASHAWGEGIYEFVECLLAAWTAGSVGAYVCFLSNPQNLDITTLIQTPQASPFYRILEARPRSVVMVANSNAVIHGRLWCCYEAFAAMRFGLDVTIAGDPTWLITAEVRETARAIFAEAASAQERAEDLLSAAQALLQRGERSLHGAREVDRVRAMLQGLMNRVPLNIRDAGCYSESDKRAIWNDIDAEVDAVNLMIKRQILEALARGLHSAMQKSLSSGAFSSASSVASIMWPEIEQSFSHRTLDSTDSWQFEVAPSSSQQDLSTVFCIMKYFR